VLSLLLEKTRPPFYKGKKTQFLLMVVQIFFFFSCCWQRPLFFLLLRGLAEASVLASGCGWRCMLVVATSASSSAKPCIYMTMAMATVQIRLVSLLQFGGRVSFFPVADGLVAATHLPTNVSS
jgi:hypothetical protein